MLPANVGCIFAKSAPLLRFKTNKRLCEAARPKQQTQVREGQGVHACARCCLPGELKAELVPVHTAQLCRGRACASPAS